MHLPPTVVSCFLKCIKDDIVWTEIEFYKVIIVNFTYHRTFFLTEELAN